MASSVSKKRYRSQTLEELFGKRKHVMVEDSSQIDNADSMVVGSPKSTNSIVETVNENNFPGVDEDSSARLCEHVVLEGYNNLFSNNESSKIFGQTVQDTLEEKHDLVVDADNPVFSEETTSPRSLECLKSDGECSTIVSEYDVGDYIGKKIDDFTKCQLLEKPWQPPKDFRFPFSEHTKRGKKAKRFASHQHLEKYNWLVFSKTKQGFFCKFCPWFTKPCGEGRYGATPLMKLVTLPLITFSKLTGETGDLETHQGRLYHKNAVESAKDFIKSYHDPSREVMCQVNQNLLHQIQENRRRLSPIIETLIFLGRQNIPLRGHRDDGNPSSTIDQKNESIVNQGNFKELLLFRVAAGDKDLENHLKTASSRATYISKTVQNELINCCGQEITNIIVDRVESSGLYSILFDETTDISHKSQMSLVLRYVYESREVREDFIGFIDAFHDVTTATTEASEDRISDDEEAGITRRSLDEGGKEYSLTGKALGQIVLRKLKKLNLRLDRCVGIGTDGCTVMLSQQKGAVSEIQKECNNALKCPCKNHKLNLSLSKSSQVTPARNSIGVMKEVVSFFKASSKRNDVLIRHLEHQMSGLCETRWVDRHDGVIQFFTDLPKILDALEEISTWQDSSTAGKAKTLATSLCDSEFLVAMNCLSDILALTLPLSKQLQKVNLDLKNAGDLVADTISTLQERRMNAEDYFRRGIWVRVTALATLLYLEIKPPRRCGRQTKRSNYEAKTAEDYYRLSIFVPLLDNVLADLNSRFDSDTFEAFHLPLILPTCLLESDATEEDVAESIKKLINLFHRLLNVSKEYGVILLQNEYILWKKKWARQSIIPSTAIEALETCDKDVYPVIHKLLQILATLPVSNATAERTFSTLRRLKSWLRSTQGQDRLTGLALLTIHREIEIATEKIIIRFGKSGNRRLNFHV